MAKKLSVQEIILTLQNYWSNQGCLLLQAYDTEKGAGTMSPYTFLRAIGPEPGMQHTWNLHAVLQMVVTGRTQTVYSNITNSKW